MRTDNLYTINNNLFLDVSSGNVGIGVQSPEATLHIQDQNNSDDSLMRFGSYGYLGEGQSGYPYLGFDLLWDGTNNNWESKHATVRGSVFRHVNSGMRFSSAPANTDPATLTDHMVIETDSGYVGIGTSSPSEMLEVAGNVKATSFIMTSDRRLKRNIASLSGLDNLLSLNGYSYEWRDNGAKTYGLIAQEVEEILPHAVHTDKKTGLKGINYNSLIAPIVESLKEFYSYIVGHEKKIRTLEEEVHDLSEKNKALEQRLLSIEKRLNK